MTTNETVWLQAYTAALKGLIARHWPEDCVADEAERQALLAVDQFNQFQLEEQRDAARRANATAP